MNRKKNRGSLAETPDAWKGTLAVTPRRSPYRLSIFAYLVAASTLLSTGCSESLSSLQSLLPVIMSLVGVAGGAASFDKNDTSAANNNQLSSSVMQLGGSLTQAGGTMRQREMATQTLAGAPAERARLAALDQEVSAKVEAARRGIVDLDTRAKTLADQRAALVAGSAANKDALIADLEAKQSELSAERARQSTALNALVLEQQKIRAEQATLESSVRAADTVPGVKRPATSTPSDTNLTTGQTAPTGT